MRRERNSACDGEMTHFFILESPTLCGGAFLFIAAARLESRVGNVFGPIACMDVRVPDSPGADSGLRRRSSIPVKKARFCGLSFVLE